MMFHDLPGVVLQAYDQSSKILPLYAVTPCWETSELY